MHGYELMQALIYFTRTYFKSGYLESCLISLSFCLWISKIGFLSSRTEFS